MLLFRISLLHLLVLAGNQVSYRKWKCLTEGCEFLMVIKSTSWSLLTYSRFITAAKGYSSDFHMRLKLADDLTNIHRSLEKSEMMSEMLFSPSVLSTSLCTTSTFRKSEGSGL